MKADNYPHTRTGRTGRTAQAEQL